jgi:flagellar biosynthesis activator protein FlaF
MSLRAYQDAQRVVEDPRQTEYRLFGQVTGALIDIKKTSAKGAPFIETLDWNRRVWKAMADDCLDDRNQLPPAIRAQIVSLSMWVARYTRRVVHNKAPIEPLIEINRTIMQGLTGSA